MPNRFKNVNGVKIELSDEEEAARDAEEKAVADAAPAKALAALRKKRDSLLAETDYHGCSDMTMSDDMKTYRQELRDLPSGKDTVKKCEDATWPSKP
tara:strand:- start:240 stop:530 length:291 start_codon:yes stop_codon:yes gene_type:complete